MHLSSAFFRAATSPFIASTVEAIKGDVAALKNGQTKTMEGLEVVLKRCPPK